MAAAHGRHRRPQRTAMRAAIADVCRAMHRDGYATVAARGGIYTLGLTRVGHPELAVDGWREEVCACLVRFVARHVALGVQYQAGVYNLAGISVELSEVPPRDYIPAHLAALAGGSVRVLKLSPAGPTPCGPAVAVAVC